MIKRIQHIAIVFIVFFMSCSKDNIDSFPNDDKHLKIMSFNIRYDNSEDGINRWLNRQTACVDMFKDIQPNVFGIQEGLVHQVEYIDNHLPQYSYYGIGRDDGKKAGEYAAIFYELDRYQRLDSGTFWLSETPEIPSIGWDADLERIVSWVKLKDIENGIVFYVFNTHFDHKGNMARVESAKLIVKKMDDIVKNDEPIFLLGDFNGLIGNKMFDPILEELKHSKKEAKDTDQKKSFNHFGKYGGILNVNIDFIFYNSMTISKYRTIDTNYGVKYISDHYPIIAWFTY